MARTTRKTKKVWVQQELDLVRTQYDRPRLGCSLYKFPSKSGAYLVASFGNYSERADRCAHVLGAGMLPGRTSAPAPTGSPLAKAGADTSARACARAGSVFATPVGNHGGNDL